MRENRQSFSLHAMHPSRDALDQNRQHGLEKTSIAAVPRGLSPRPLDAWVKIERHDGDQGCCGAASRGGEERRRERRWLRPQQGIRPAATALL
jgi:hypothetical protein